MFGIADQATIEILFLDALNESVFTQIDEFASSERPTKDRKHCEDQERGLNKYFLSFILIIDHFYIALFSALEQTHCAVVACDSERVTASSQNIPGLPSGGRAANRYFT